MLLPFEFAILSKEDADLLIKFIKAQFTSKSGVMNYKKMIELGIMDIYNRLEDFTRKSSHYEHELSSLDPYSFVRED